MTRPKPKQPDRVTAWLKQIMAEQERALRKAKLPPKCWRDIILDVAALVAHPEKPPHDFIQIQNFRIKAWDRLDRSQLAGYLGNHGVAEYRRQLTPLARFMDTRFEDEHEHVMTIVLGAMRAAVADAALQTSQLGERLRLGQLLTVLDPSVVHPETAHRIIENYKTVAPKRAAVKTARIKRERIEQRRQYAIGRRQMGATREEVLCELTRDPLFGKISHGQTEKQLVGLFPRRQRKGQKKA